MDLSDPWLLLSGVLIGAVGMGLFVFGKKQGEAMPILAGLLMGVYPMFVTSLVLEWGIFAAIIAGLVAVRRM
jgi:hypothetical protein